MKRKSFGFIQSISVLFVFELFAFTYPIYAQDLSGKVYEGQTGTEPPPLGDAKPIENATVSLYGSDDASDDGTGSLPIQTTTTNSEGWYSLTVRGAYDFYNIVQTNKTDYADSGATSVDGTVKSSNWIQYRYEDIFVTPVTMTGNKFWDIKEGEEPPENNPPVADAGGPYSTQVGKPVLLDGSGSYDPDAGDSITGYQWYWLNQENYNPINGVRTTPTITWVPPVAGQLTIKLEVTDSHGESDTDTATVTVEEGDEPPVGTGTLDGYKRDADTQEGLDGWRIYIDLNGNGQWDEGEPYDTTDSNGYFRIEEVEPGTYRVCEEMQDGWEPAGGSSACIEGVDIIAGTTTTQDFHNRRTENPEPETSWIEGSKYNDVNGNGQWDINEPGLSGWRIYQDINENGIWDNGEPNAVTDSNGECGFWTKPYNYPNQKPAIREVPQSGWAQTEPGALQNYCYDLHSYETLWPEPICFGMRFGNHQTGIEPPERTGSIKIIKSALMDSTVPFDFTGDLGPFTLKIGESKVFSQLPPGQYTVTESLPGEDWKMGNYQIAGDLDGGTTSNPTAQSITIDLDAGENITLVIYNYIEEEPEPGTGSIRGVKFNDLNENGRKDDGEPCISGWEIVLTDSNGVVLTTTTTNQNGEYQFDNLETGIYGVSEEDKQDWFQTFPAEKHYSGVRLSEGEVLMDMDFGNHWTGTEPPEGTATIRGMKYNDLNRNGQRDWGEPGLANWKIYVDLSHNAKWEEGEPYAITDSDGNYTLSEVPIHSSFCQNIHEVMQDGWSSITYYHYCITGGHGDVFENIDFGNYRTGTEPSEGTYYTSDACFNVEITTPTGTVEKLTLTGPMTQRVYVGPNGEASDAGGNGREEVTTELVGLNLSGISPSLGPVKVSLNTNMPSMGQIEERTNNTPGILDIPPFTTTGDADSFFDVFFQLEVGGTVLLTSPSQPIRLTSVITHLPPAEDYSDISQTKVELLDQNGQPTGFYFGPITSCQQPPPGGEGGGSVVVIKEAAPADDTQFLFCANFSPGGFFDTLCIYLTDPSINTWTFNNPNMLQKVSETITAGWTLTDITINGDTDNGSTIDVVNATVDVDFDEGENIVITFKNEKTGEGQYDYGDAPDSFGTLKNNGGPYHDIGQIMFGSSVDAEADGQPGQFADADSDDGISFMQDLEVNKSAIVMLTINAPSGELTGVEGWIDFDRSLTFESDELIVNTYHVGTGAPVFQPETIQVPGDAVPGWTYARFRIHDKDIAAGGLSPTGYGGEGEVEDYRVEIKGDGPSVPPGVFLHVFKWNDINGDKNWTFGEPVLPGWTIWLDANQNGIEDTGDQYVQTDMNGYAQFAGLALGQQYTVGEVQQAGWTQTFPGGSGTHTVTGDPNLLKIAILFGNRQSDGSTFDGRICGSKWNDLNGDGIPDANEPFLAGWTTYLDINKNNQWDWGEPNQLTDVSGSFEFTGLAVGSYTLAEEMQPGWKQTWPGGTETHIISVPSGLVQPACVMFGNQQTGAGLPLDWGDAPDPNYPTLRASNGAYHVIVPGIFLGGGVDPEIDGLPSPDALGDDNNGSGDEDGVTFITSIMPGQLAEVEVIASSMGYLDAWIDFDADGSWSQSSDQIFQSEAIPAGSNILNFQIPANIVIDIDTYARFRFSSTGGLSPDGAAQDGEVEDYHILLGENGPYVQGEGQVPHVKWSQPPIEIDPNTNVPPVLCGWNEPARSTEQSGSKRQWRMDADDFHCLGPIPITRIRWWGGYKVWTQSEPPESQPEIWHIGIWANQVEGIIQDESFLERLVWSIEVPNERVHREPVGIEEFPEKNPEMCYFYELILEPEEWFHQSEYESNDDVFWLSITAIYPTDIEQINMWGWTTRPHTWGSGAVMPAIMGDWPTYDERLFPGRIYPIENDLLCGENQSYDLCFELLTEYPWVKWDQPFTGIREWQDYSDHKSMALEHDEEHLSVLCRTADDWVCESQAPVTAIAWHGSYIGYGYEACTCEQMPAPRKPDYFLLSIRENNIAAIADPYNIPGEIIWEFRAENYNEVLVGYDKNPDGEPNEPVFRYSVRLPEDMWFRQETPESVYWLSIVAVFRESSSEEIPYDWGWTNHSHTFGNPAMSLDVENQTEPKWQPLLDTNTWPADMSFMFFTAPEIKPIAYWKFDETQGTTAIDSSGRHHGKVYNGTWTDGIIDGALNLNGLNGYVDCGDSDLLGPEQMTITMWLRPEHSGGARYIVSRGQHSDNLDYAVIRWLEGEIEITLSQNGGAHISLASTGQVPLNQWSHVAVTCGGESACVYINGILDCSAMVTPRAPYNESRFVIGSLLSETLFYNGRIDDIQIYDCVLSSEQIIALSTAP